MLILTRRTGEAICIADDTKVRILSVRGNQVRVGIDAPPDVVVDREEIALRKRSEERRPPPGQ